MVQDIKITPTPISYSGSVATATGEPQLLFRGSGASANDIELNVQSNSDLSFQGTQGELFSITNELQSGTIFAVKDISGLDQISVNASGTIKLNPFYGKTAVSGALFNSIISSSGSGTQNLDLDTSNNFSHIFEGTGTTTFTTTNHNIGHKFMVRVKQDDDGGGSGTVTWFNGIKWAGGTAPSLTATADKADLFGFFCSSASGTNLQSGSFDGFVIGQNI